METWKEKADRIGAVVVIFDPDIYPNSEELEKVDGWAVYDEEFGIKVAFVNAHRSTIAQGNISYHELEHLEQGHSHYPIGTAGIMQESYANNCMLEERADVYMKGYDEITEETYVDINNFLDLYELSHEYYHKAEKIIKRKLSERLNFNYK
ncbi:MAG: hypothetical protein ACRCZN_05685 [Lactococcus lactis]